MNQSDNKNNTNHANATNHSDDLSNANQILETNPAILSETVQKFKSRNSDADFNMASQSQDANANLPKIKHAASYDKKPNNLPLNSNANSNAGSNIHGASAAMIADSAEPSFEDFGLDPILLKKLEQMNIKKPTQIQMQSIPLLIDGADILASSKTGSGKTLAFCLPLIHNLLPKLDSSPSPAKHPVRILILAPTRELATQVYEAAAQLLKNTPARLICLQGGMNMREQKANLLKGCDVVVATIGRLLDHVRQQTIKLNQLNGLVLDEADRMLDMGFLPDLETLIQYLPVKRQTLMFSATFSPAISKIAKKYLYEHKTIQATQSNQTNEQIEQIIYRVKSNQKPQVLLHIIQHQHRLALAKPVGERNKQSIIFLNSKSECTKIQNLLDDYGFNSEILNGDVQQSQRQKIMQAFKNQKIDILVATDVAARGLDVPELPLVINYQLPFGSEDYVHRIGRTGRAGASGKAISFYTDREADILKGIRAFTKQKLTLREFDARDFKAPPPPVEKKEALAATSVAPSSEKAAPAEVYSKKVGMLLCDLAYTPKAKKRLANVMGRTKTQTTGVLLGD